MDEGNGRGLGGHYVVLVRQSYPRGASTSDSHPVQSANQQGSKNRRKKESAPKRGTNPIGRISSENSTFAPGRFQGLRLTRFLAGTASPWAGWVRSPTSFSMVVD